MKKNLLKFTLNKFSVLFLSGAAVILTANTQAQTITTIAGTGTAGFNGNGILATTADLHTSSGVTVDPMGNVFIADNLNSMVRRVDASSGIITDYAGNGVNGFYGDGGPATAAEMGEPWNVTLDAAGNVYIADWVNDRIRMVTASTGIITTIIGTGSAGYNGDGMQATITEVNHAQGMFVDKMGNIYFADVDNQRVRMINTSGIVSTIAGTGTPGYNGDGIMATNAELHNTCAVTVDTLGNVYFADYFNNEVRKVTASTGMISSVAGNTVGSYYGDGGHATNAELYNPTGVCIDANSNIYIADFTNQRIREVSSFSGIITTVAGIGVAGYSGDGGMATAAEINNPWDVAVTPKAFYIAEYTGDRIRKVALSTEGIAQISNEINATIYPNPVTDDLFVKLDGVSGKTNFTLFNLVGQQVMQQFSNEITTSIPANGLAAGIYILKIQTADGSVLTSKVSVDRK